jgi:hypothetical protein
MLSDPQVMLKDARTPSTAGPIPQYGNWLFRDGTQRSINVDSFSDLNRMTDTRFMTAASSTAGDQSSLGSPLLTPAEGS